MGDEVYFRLREFLDKLPGGFPSTDSGVELKLLKKLFTPEEAQLDLCLNWDPEPAGKIAERCGMDELETARRLESMAKKGLIYRDRKSGEARYRAEQFVVGIFEYQLDLMDAEFCRLLEEYWPYLGMSWAMNKTSQMRVVPVASAVDTTPTIADYDRIRDLVKEKQTVGLFPCVCRRQQALLGNKCERPADFCMGFGEFVDFYLENEWSGRKVSSEEALRILDRSEEAGLVLNTDNGKDIMFVCSCCSCCCPALRLIKILPNPADFVQSSFRSVIDAEKCEACSTCIERCPMDAIVEGDEFMEVNPARCIGCGVCLPTCEQEAISLVQKEEIVVPPADFEEALARISAERGLTQ